MKFTSVEEEGIDCQCCGYRTISERYSYDICAACGWEEEDPCGVPDDQIIGGANGDYSINEARENFAKYGTKYRPGDHRFIRDPEIDEVHSRLVAVLQEIKTSGTNPILERRAIDLSSEKFWTTTRIIERERSKGHPRLNADDSVNCPVCELPTQHEVGSGRSCIVCEWHDEFAQYSSTTEPLGKKNGDYSLDEARRNYAKYGKMFRPGDAKFIRHPKVIELDRRIASTYEEIKRTGRTDELERKLEELIREWLTVSDQFE